MQLSWIRSNQVFRPFRHIIATDGPFQQTIQEHWQSVQHIVHIHGSLGPASFSLKMDQLGFGVPILISLLSLVRIFHFLIYNDLLGHGLPLQLIHSVLASSPSATLIPTMVILIILPLIVLVPQLGQCNSGSDGHGPVHGVVDAEVQLPAAEHQHGAQGVLGVDLLEAGQREGGRSVARTVGSIDQ